MIFYFFVLLRSVYATPEYGECGKCTIPNELTVSENKTYFFGTYIKLNWYGVNEHCGLLGMTSLTIDSKYELDFLVSAIKKYDYKHEFWTSGININTIYRWMSTGVRIYTKSEIWGHNQPGIDEMGMCLSLSPNLDHKLQNADCSSSFYFICEIRKCKLHYY